jgi:alpha-D-ribose 1-methylphosphonate 5-triphosphate diphosphatase PhnM
MNNIASVTDRDGRIKVVLQAAPPELVTQFMAGEIVPGLVDMYGDPARGFAGGYVA